MKYPNLWNMLFNAPLMLHEPTAQHFADMFLVIQRDGLAAAQALAAAAIVPQPHAYADNVAIGARYKQKPYAVTDAGIGLLPVHGVLVQRAGQISPDCTEMTSYQRISATFNAMMNDADVRGILLELDSPGGQVAGNFGLANDMLAARATKPIWAHANAMAFSAGYSILSTAERSFAPMEAMVGSIGVIMQHVDQSAKDAKSGYLYTTIKSGANKGIFDPHAPLSKSDQAWAQNEVDRTRMLFAQIVAQGRGMDIKAVLDTEASIYGAPDGKAIGLIDDIATFTETLAAFEQRLNAGSAFVFQPAGGIAAQPLPKELTMSDPKAAPAAAPANPQPAAEAIVAPAAPAAAVAPAITERTRIQGITTHAEAAGREGLASHLAFATDMSVEDAVKALAASPKAGATNALALAMAAVPNPKVGVDGQPAAEAKPTINTADIYARRAAASLAAAR